MYLTKKYFYLDSRYIFYGLYTSLCLADASFYCIKMVALFYCSQVQSNKETSVLIQTVMLVAA